MKFEEIVRILVTKPCSFSEQRACLLNHLCTFTGDFFATGPLYAQSYLYANMIATQLREAMREQFGVDDLTREPRVGAWLTERFFAPGASVPWREKVQRATGKPLSTDALARYLAGAIPPESAGRSPS